MFFLGFIYSSLTIPAWYLCPPSFLPQFFETTLKEILSNTSPFFMSYYSLQTKGIHVVLHLKFHVYNFDMEPMRHDSILHYFFFTFPTECLFGLAFILKKPTD